MFNELKNIYDSIFWMDSIECLMNAQEKLSEKSTATAKAAATAATKQTHQSKLDNEKIKPTPKTYNTYMHRFLETGEKRYRERDIEREIEQLPTRWTKKIMVILFSFFGTVIRTWMPSERHVCGCNFSCCVWVCVVFSLLPLVFVVSSSSDFSSLWVTWLLGALQHFSLPVYCFLNNTRNTRSHSHIVVAIFRFDFFYATIRFAVVENMHTRFDEFVTVIAISYCYVCLGFYHAFAQIKHNDIIIIGEKKKRR